MSRTRVPLLLIIILAISSVRYGTPLECYVCTSVENPACTSSLSDIGRSTCSSDETTETTLVSTGPTSTSDSIKTTITTITDATTNEDSSSESTTTAASTSSTTTDATSTVDSSSRSTISETTSTEFSSLATVTEEIALTETETITSTTETITTQNTDPTDVNVEAPVFSLADLSVSNRVSKLVNNSELVLRVVRDSDVEFACYTLTLNINDETVTERGCVAQSSSMCETLNEEKYPGQNLTTCTTCTEDGCNSAGNHLSAIPSLFLPLIMFSLMK